jgi:hypothetical protein
LFVPAHSNRSFAQVARAYAIPFSWYSAMSQFNWVRRLGLVDHPFDRGATGIHAHLAHKGRGDVRARLHASEAVQSILFLRVRSRAIAMLRPRIIT